MPYERFQEHVAKQLADIDAAGLTKRERVILSPQGTHVATTARGDLLNMCANNYLGMADHPEVVQAAREAAERWGYGMASVRFICGTQQPHTQLEGALSQFLGTEATIL